MWLNEAAANAGMLRPAPRHKRVNNTGTQQGQANKGDANKGQAEPRKRQRFIIRCAPPLPNSF
jgi:hypothetical protein